MWWSINFVIVHIQIKLFKIGLWILWFLVYHGKLKCCQISEVGLRYLVHIDVNPARAWEHLYKIMLYNFKNHLSQNWPINRIASLENMGNSYFVLGPKIKGSFVTIMKDSSHERLLLFSLHFDFKICGDFIVKMTDRELVNNEIRVCPLNQQTIKGVRLISYTSFEDVGTTLMLPTNCFIGTEEAVEIDFLFVIILFTLRYPERGRFHKLCKIYYLYELTTTTIPCLSVNVAALFASSKFTNDSVSSALM